MKSAFLSERNIEHYDYQSPHGYSSVNWFYYSIVPTQGEGGGGGPPIKKKGVVCRTLKGLKNFFWFLLG